MFLMSFSLWRPKTLVVTIDFWQKTTFAGGIRNESLWRIRRDEREANHFFSCSFFVGGLLVTNILCIYVILLILEFLKRKKVASLSLSSWFTFSTSLTDAILWTLRFLSSRWQLKMPILELLVGPIQWRTWQHTVCCRSLFRLLRQHQFQQFMLHKRKREEEMLKKLQLCPK